MPYAECILRQSKGAKSGPMALIVESSSVNVIALALTIIASVAITGILLVVGFKAARFLLRRAAGLGRAPSTLESHEAASADLQHSKTSLAMPALSLNELLLENTVKSPTSEILINIKTRINDLAALVTDAHTALARDGASGLNAAARKIVEGRRLTGPEWRKYLAASGAAAQVGAQVNAALLKDVAPLVSEILRLLAAKPVDPIVRREEGYVLACAACVESAVTFRPSNSGFCARNISNVNKTICWDGDAGKRLGEILAAGDTHALLDYFASPNGAHCPAFCPSCHRVYCAGHYALAEEWSGSWYSAGYVTCVLGHEREYE